MAELSQRESEVLELALRGLTNEEIAVRLAISRRTVETHMRMVFHKTGVTRRGQLAALYPADARTAPAASPSAAQEAGPTRGGRRSELYTAAIDRLIDRQFPLFDESVEITATVGEHEGGDGIVERRWTTPKPYLIHRVLRPIVPTGGAAPLDPDDLALSCDVTGRDTYAEVCPMLGANGMPLVMVLFQPGLHETTEWTLRYRSPGLWNPLREHGRDTLRWWTATAEQRHRPAIDRITFRAVFPPGWSDEGVTEDGGLGTTDVERLPTGRVRATWQDATPVAAGYTWVLRGRSGRPEEAEQPEQQD